MSWPTHWGVPLSILEATRQHPRALSFSVTAKSDRHAADMLCWSAPEGSGSSEDQDTTEREVVPQSDGDVARGASTMGPLCKTTIRGEPGNVPIQSADLVVGILADLDRDGVH